SSSGKGQSLITDQQDIQKAWDYALSGGRVETSRIIVEEKIEFDYEITLLTVRALNAAGETETVFCEPIGHIQKNGDYVESWQPQAMSKNVLSRAQEMARAVTDNLGGRGLFGVEFFIRGDEVFFSEVSPRPHDTGMVTMASQVQNEFELHARAVLGLPVSTVLRTPAASAVIYGGMEEQGISFENIEKALAVPQSDIRLFGKPESFRRRRMGVALAYDDKVETARDNAKKAAALVRPVKA
ncbi:MAG: formate-dependent phosphoribosylglycinamide formyltransferase, partial [Gammaproteobacteria bacterium]|nr:formate-dependent phosphoribosylglycinamide formyltransferase [Gammaproteobacteria bacterium]